MIYTNGSVYLSALVHIPIQDIFTLIFIHAHLYMSQCEHIMSP